MRLVCISDTHGSHEELVLPEGDVLIHAGDFSTWGREKDTRVFLDWFASQSHPNKILIAGNHDWLTERHPGLFRAFLEDHPGITYLEDSGTEIEGILFWGSPVQPRFGNWAWNRDRGPDIRRHWDMIPEHTGVLVTHGPPYQVGDRVSRKHEEQVGCTDLRDRICQIKNLKVSVFGHIHEDYGVHALPEHPGVFVNASVLNGSYILKNDPVVIEI